MIGRLVDLLSMLCLLLFCMFCSPGQCYCLCIVFYVCFALKMILKTQEITCKSSQKGDVCEAPEPGGSRRCDEALPSSIPFLAGFAIYFLRFEAHESCSARVLKTGHFGFAVNVAHEVLLCLLPVHT